ncbi:hypothetical protein OIU84_006626 [Salix udensis]|uniref:Uncharacterized protein n=1 Tax=Salix udensis TaxID=889485 RepID=A0AAD6K132_9ROSI|nr:hypothetical protein OIU84_006626 [Salix udensis]
MIKKIAKRLLFLYIYIYIFFFYGEIAN